MAGRTVYRHTAPVRIMHWINVVCLFLLLFSGFQIFNAHPALYWGEASHFESPLLAMEARAPEGPRLFVASDLSVVRGARPCRAA